MKRHVLRSSELEVVVEPLWGGKTTSILHRKNSMELLFQPALLRSGSRDNFAEWAFGWDDCWPSVNEDGPEYPDHGALWRRPAEVLARSEQSLTSKTADPFQRWIYTKTWTLDRDELAVDVAIENISSLPFEGFWTLHALVRAEKDQVLLLPPRHSGRETVYGPDFGEDSLPPSGTASKFWLREIAEGRCGIRYPSLGMEYTLAWDEQKLPHLGFWVTNGGFQGDINQAWEPSDGYYDSIPTARTNGALPRLNAGETRRFSFSLRWSQIERLRGRF